MFRLDAKFLYSVISTPFLSGLIGWVTTYLAILMIFRPREPVRFLGVTYQGIVPKKRHHIAMSIGRSVERNMISVEDFQDMINKVNLEEEVEKIIDKYVDDKIGGKGSEKSFVGRSYNAAMGPVKVQVKKYLTAQISSNANEIIKSFVDRLETEFDIQELVARRIDEYDIETLENVVLGFTKTEFKFLEIMGGIFGFLIGLVQTLVMIAIHFVK